MSYQFSLVPRDVLFLRDARPMAAADAGKGANWPRPDQLYSAVHHTFLTQWPSMQEWEGGEHTRNLPADKNQNSSFRFGALRTFGPFPMKDGEVYLPCPLDLGMEVIKSGNTDLPAPLTHAFISRQEGKVSFPAWVPGSAFKAYLAGETPDLSRVEDNDLYGVDRNIGIAIDPATGTTVEHKLYQAEYLRLQKDVSLFFEADCVLKPKGLSGTVDVFARPDMPRHLVMGGQQGICSLEKISNLKSEISNLSSNYATNITTWYLRWTLLTPAVFRGGWLPGWIRAADGRVMLPKSRVDRGPGESRTAWKARQNAAGSFAGATLIAARVGKAVAFSGWDERAFKKPDMPDPQKWIGAPKPTMLAVPAGSSYVFKCQDVDEAKALAQVLDYPNRRSDFFGEKGFGVGVSSSITVQK